MMGRFNYLPKDIMLEILIRLPTELVLECKLVCKLWRDIVCLPSFSQLHLARLNSYAHDSGKFNLIILTYKRDLTEKNYSLPDLDLYYYAECDENCPETPLREIRMNFKPPKNCFFGCSCNGLMCFISKNFVSYGGPYCICNPITREFIILPKNFEGYYFKFWYGFGYSSSTNEYKVVRMYWSGEADAGIVLQIYTLGSGNGWRTVQNMDMNMMKQVYICLGEFANGALHWLDNAGTLIAFNLTDEMFSELPSPPCLRQAVFPIIFYGLKALSGFLSFYDEESGCTELWLLKTNIDNSDLSCSDFSFKKAISQLGFMNSGTLLCNGYAEVYPHQNTLVSLKVLGEKDTKRMEFGERASSSDETGNTDKLKKPQT